jgi:alkaline phosphatase D
MKSLATLLFTLQLFIGLQAQQYPDNIYADTAYAPFLYGVASGDPQQDKVIIWTKVEPRKECGDVIIGLKWQVAEDSAFLKIVQRGETAAFEGTDFTAKVDVTKLQAGHRYFYRFLTSCDGKISQTGKARTLPNDSVKQFKLAVVSCSSIWAGYFNAYRRIAEREDIDFVIHLGDYAYDYADKQQLNRMPSEYPKDVSSLKEWRERHTYYLLDPDLRAARQNKTWIAEWDNHDTDCEPLGTVGDAIRAFYEYLPIRIPDENNLTRIYRSFHFGALADLVMLDMFLFRGKEEYAAGKKSVLGLKQDAWVKSELQKSRATWKLIGNQEMMNDWLSEGAPKFIKHGNGHVFDSGNWNGFPQDRQRLYDFIDTNHIHNVVVLTGDIHMSFVMDMTGTPKDKTKYNPKTGAGAIGVELTGPSISRINMKDAGVPGGFIPLVQTISKSLNPHHRWCQFSKHGYFTLDVTPEKCNAEFWYSIIKRKTNKETFGRGFTVKQNVNHWERKASLRPFRKAGS